MKKLFAIFALCGALGHASALSDLMTAYQRAPQAQKYKIMNQIKLEIAKLHKARQANAIAQLQKTLRQTTAQKQVRRTKALDVLNGKEAFSQHTNNKRGRGGRGGNGGGHGGGGRR